MCAIMVRVCRKSRSKGPLKLPESTRSSIAHSERKLQGDLRVVGETDQAQASAAERYSERQDGIGDF